MKSIILCAAVLALEITNAAAEGFRFRKGAHDLHRRTDT
jgi:hypothetical protein